MYNKTTWKTGDVVTSEKLNKMENGIADIHAVFLVQLFYDNEHASYYTDKTFTEISNAVSNGEIIFLSIIDGTSTNFIPLVGISSEYGAMFESFAMLNDGIRMIGYLVEVDNTVHQMFANINGGNDENNIPAQE